MKENNEEIFHSIQSVLSVLGEIHLLETYFNGFDQTLSILLTDEEINGLLSPDRLFSLHSDVECVKSDIHDITRKLLLIASEISNVRQLQKNTTASMADIKIENIGQKNNLVDKNVWIENASKYFYDLYNKNNTDE